MKTLNCFLLTFFFISQLTAQMNVGTNTLALQMNMRIDILSLARASAFEKDFEKADRLLTAYTTDHTDMDAFRLHAQILYWMKDFNRSIAVYEKAIHLFPEAYPIKLDYARVLFSLNKLNKANRLLKSYHQFDSSNVEAKIMVSYIDMWTGKIGSAKEKAVQLLQQYPGNAEATDIITKVGYYTLPYIKTGIESFADDQPLKGYSFHAETGVYKSWLFAPTLQASVYQFKAGDSSFNSRWLRATNDIQLGLNTKLKLQAGGFLQNNNTLSGTGSLELARKLGRDFSMQAAVEKRPYQHALASISTAVMENASSLSLTYNRKDKWLGKAAYELLTYKDGNTVQTAYLWMLVPVVQRPHFSVSGGYAFRYADAANNHFVSKQPVSKLLASQSYSGFAGVYDPYFTPESQLVHAALGSVKYAVSKKLQLSSRVSVGFSAKAKNPYLWLQKSGSRYTVERGFAPVNFMPVSWTNEVNLAVSNKLSFAANYSYDKLLYYTINKGSISLKYVFLK